MNSSALVNKKALLLEAGAIHLLNPDLSALAERPSAGPDAGLKGLYLGFGRHRVRMTVAQNPSETPFQLKRGGDGYCVMRGESTFLRNVTVETPFLHSPNQAFINLASPCIFNCKFCATPKLKIRFTLSPRKVLTLIRSAMRRGGVEAVALTSGVIGSEKQTIRLMVDAVRLIREELGHQIPVGVEPYVTRKSYVEKLYSVGADEMKVNVESFDREIIKVICSDIDYDKVVSALEYSVDVFGRNRVCSNVLIGLGESDDTVLNGLKWMAERGVVANLRPLLINPLRRQDLAEATQGRAARPSAARMLKLALSHRSILEKQGLKTSMFKTMCHKCTGCEITPQQDV
ncbi:MAG: radical SAM protein [Candidatus Bathyarchaeota archaeon]|nr:radical SAM protein [Candidatus Bathyarchaeota archaeon]